MVLAEARELGKCQKSFSKRFPSQGKNE